MTIWQRLLRRLSSLGGNALLTLFGGARPPEAREGFTIAVVALGAKMAKADGRVTREEVTAFREIFRIEDADLPAVGRFFDLARRDVAGFDLYAARIARMFEPGDPVLEALVDALFTVARADGALHEAELVLLREVARIFGLGEGAFDAIAARHVGGGQAPPHEVLGVAPDAPFAAVRGAWKALARRYHPDGLRARGIPDEAARLAEARMAEINAAYDLLRRRADAARHTQRELTS